MNKSALALLATGILFLAPIGASQEKKVEVKNYPNPFDQKTTIEYTLKDSTEVSLIVFDKNWNGVDTLVWREMQGPGKHSYEFDATGKTTGKLPYRTGTSMEVYLYQIRSPRYILAWDKMFKNSR